MSRLAWIFATALAVPFAAGAAPQEQETDAPAHVAYVEGMATLERDGRPETAPLNMPLLTGDRLKTLDGRVEVLFGDGSALHLDARTTIDLQADDLVRLIDGRVRFTIAGVTDATRPGPAGVVYRIDSPAGSVRITQPGEYRVAILRRGDETQLELAVLRGAGEIFTDEGTTAVRAGERAYASAGLAPSYAYTYNSANWDAFDRWSESRRDTRLGVSAQYLPSDVRAYASTFDEDGDWRYAQPYGYVWYPRVAASWRPYYYGRWAQYPRYGWTWIGADRFAWATHHYGRWGFSAGAWFWIPSNRWAPAYVSWAYAPGYVSWCPLGFDNRPVIAINIFNARPGYYSSSRAWTAIGSSYFGRDYVHRRAVDWDRLDRGRRPSFQLARSAPASRDVAVPRSAPLGTAPRYINRGDEILRSRSGRPSAPAQPLPQRTTEAATRVGRTAPDGAARRVEAPGTASAPTEIGRTRLGREQLPFSSARPSYDRGSVMPRADHPVYAPRFEGSRAIPRGTAPAPIAPDGPIRQAAPDRGPGAFARPRPSTGAEGRAEAAPRPAPSYERPAPGPDRSVPSRAVPREAAPRSAPGGGGRQPAARPRSGGRQ